MLIIGYITKIMIIIWFMPAQQFMRNLYCVINLRSLIKQKPGSKGRLITKRKIYFRPHLITPESNKLSLGYNIQLI